MNDDVFMKIVMGFFAVTLACSLGVLVDLEYRKLDIFEEAGCVTRWTTQ